MKQLWHTLHVFPLTISLIAASGQTLAQQAGDDEELAAAYGDKTFISIATGSKQSVNRAPSTATVITARDIQAMAATDLRQVLESVPGLHVNVSPISYTPLFYFRGIGSAYNPEVLVLVNGKKINTNFRGNPTLLLGGFPLENIARIEVIRGPGSALYGADAFSGVINIETKGADEINGLVYGARIGSYRSRDTWLQYGGKSGSLKSAFYLRYGKTDGYRGTIEKDLQSNLDPIFGSRASLAPGPLNLDAEELDAQLDLSLDHWRLQASVQNRKLGTGAGLAESLDPIGKFPEARYSLNLTWQKNNFIPSWNIAASYTHFHLVEKVGSPAYVLFPPGAFGGQFPNGMIGNPGHSERHHRLEFSGTWTGLAQHQLRVGAGYEIEDLYKIEEYKNFTFTPAPGGGSILTPLGQIVNAAGDPALIYLTPHKHSLSYIFVQDEWNFAQDWTLTAGLRHDRYSDFGSTTNPRLALVWNAAYNLVLKAIHGRAFRAPSFSDQYSINNPVAIGNPNISPEKISSNELAAIWRVKPGLQCNLTLFQYTQKNIIQYVTDPGPNGTATAQNTGDQTGHGFELEGTWDVNSKWRLSGNYSFQRSKDKTSGKDAGLSPHHHLFLRSNWQFAPFWQMGAALNYVANRQRQPQDMRPPIADYVTLDLNVRRERVWHNWELQVAVKNLFNRDVREPSLAPGNIQFDLPQPRRSLHAQMIYKF